MTGSKREALGQIVIRPPEGMRERIKAAADANNRSMNQEIVATLEEKYPPQSIDLRMIGSFLNSLERGRSDDPEFPERTAYIEALNMLMMGLPRPYKIVENCGAITFVPVKMHVKDITNVDLMLKILNERLLPDLTKNMSADDISALQDEISKNEGRKSE